MDREVLGRHVTDKYVKAVKAKLTNRAAAGLIKYGVNLEREDLNTLDWLNHLQEELLDASGYLEVLIQREEENERFHSK